MVLVVLSKLPVAAGAVEEVGIPPLLRDFQAMWKSPAFGLFLGAASSTDRSTIFASEPSCSTLNSHATCLKVVDTLRFDLPIAERVNGNLGSTEGLATGFASVVLLGVEAAVVLALVIIRIMRGHLSSFRETTALACLASICAYAINDGTLKFFFGVPNPAVVLQGTQHAFNLLSGSSKSSFPSGHMVLAGAFAAVFMRLYRTSILPLSALLLVAAVLLIIGDWHFVSDVIAGTFVGVSAGLLAGELWLAHSK